MDQMSPRVFTSAIVRLVWYEFYQMMLSVTDLSLNPLNYGRGYLASFLILHLVDVLSTGFGLFGYENKNTE